MGSIPVNTRMPYGDHIETRNSDWRLEHDQPLIVLAQQARRNECDKIVVCNISGRSRKLDTE